MLVYRILPTKYIDKFVGSGRVARWNSDDVEIIYTASSRSLACLENAVHRSQPALSQLFSVLTINCPDILKVKIISLKDLPLQWTDFNQMFFTQNIGDKWARERETAVLQVPSAIINEEVNYLLNPNHKDFAKIKVIKSQPFTFDSRIKD